ncbi:MAG TPA: AAA family ATPase [Aliidongia sp.]|nr:AAA family ATPase [Aliidongia sp.]
MAEEDQAEAIALLAEPLTHGGQPVERMETHASLIFLAGDRVYKLKRAVRYSYLDYSTEPLRRAACDRELELNRRFAPDLYLAVNPVNRHEDGTLSIGGHGRPVDWVLEMRRFADDDLFDRMAQDGRLTPELMSRLAERIVAAHHAAPLAPDMGGEAGIAEAIETTHINLRPGEAFGLGDIERWHAAVVSALAIQRDLLEHRRQTGKVRECHGDLHLRNICLFEDCPTLFDGIEFSRSIACIDVLFDLAFLLMDLHHRNLDDLGNLLFNRYLDLSDEAEGLPLLPLFLSLRAGIRAQVTETAGRRLADRAAHARAMVEAHSYLDLAIALLHPVEPCLVAVGGFSGTGKTTLARGLAPLLPPVPGARVLRSDMVRKHFLGVAETTRLPEEAYGPAASAAVYARLDEMAAATLASGCSVILDAVFARPDERQAVAELARSAQVSFHGVWLTAAPATLEARVTGRSGDASDATAAVVRRQVARGAGPIEWTILDAELAPARSLAAAAEAAGIRRL